MSLSAQGASSRVSVRDRLLCAADELFYADGIVSTGVDAVIERAGVATGSLYNTFGGKDALIQAYLQARDQRWRVHWERCIAEHADPGARVLAIFTAVERWFSQPVKYRGCAHLAAALQLPPDHPGTEAAVAHKQHLSDRLQQLCEATEAADAAGLASDLLLIYEGMINMLAMDLDPDPINRARTLATHRIGQAP